MTDMSTPSKISIIAGFVCAFATFVAFVVSMSVGKPYFLWPAAATMFCCVCIAVTALLDMNKWDR